MIFLKNTAALFLVLIICLSFSCQNESSKKVDFALEALPSNASIITAFDLPTLMKKANFEVVKKLDFYRFFMEKAQEESDLLATVLANPENAGIDLSKPAYMSIELDENNPEIIYTGLIFNLASTEDFKAFSASFSNAVLKDQGDFQTAYLNETSLLSWNNKIGIIGFGEGIMEAEAVVEAFFKADKAHNLAKDENLTKLLSKPHDVTTWLTSNALAKNKNARLLLSMAKIDPKAFQDNFIHAHLDFENGEVNAKANYFFQDAFIEDIRLVFKEQVKTDFSHYIPAKNLNAYVSIGLDFEGLNIALKKRNQVKIFIDFFLKTYGLSLDKIRNSLDGDLLLATYTGNINNRQESIFAAKLNDEASFRNLLAIAEEHELVTKTGNGRYLISPQINQLIRQWLPLELGSMYDNQLMIYEGIAFLSDNIELLDIIETGNKNNPTQVPINLKELMLQNPFSLFVDFNSLKRIGVPGAENLDLLEMSSNKTGIDFQLEMKQKEINSLQAIFEAINEAYLKRKEQKQPVSQEKI